MDVRPACILTSLGSCFRVLWLQVLDWFESRSLRAYSISCGQSLLYNNIFPKHKERLGKKMSELVGWGWLEHHRLHEDNLLLSHGQPTKPTHAFQARQTKQYFAGRCWQVLSS